MAPHALTDLNDTSGYYPLTANSIWSETPAYHKSLKTPPTDKPALSAKIPFGNLGFGNDVPRNVWILSSDEISEIEKNVRHFLGRYKTPSMAHMISIEDQTRTYRSARSIKQHFP